MAQESVATYKIELSLVGMKIQGAPDGAGDRKMEFDIQTPADDMEAANALWYGHLEALFGETQDVSKMKAMAEAMAKNS